MRRTHVFLSAAAALLVSTTAFAQAKPSFAGKWAILPDSGAVQQQGMPRGGGTMGGLGEEAVITQDEKVFTVTRNTPNGELKTSYNLDGTETYTSVAVQNGSIPLTLKSRWDSNKLITSIWANVGQQIEIILVFSLDDKGNLVTEHTLPPMGNQQGGTIVTKYKKQ